MLENEQNKLQRFFLKSPKKLDLREGIRQAGMLAFPFAAAREREKHAKCVSHVFQGFFDILRYCPIASNTPLGIFGTQRPQVGVLSHRRYRKTGNLGKSKIPGFYVNNLENLLGTQADAMLLGCISFRKMLSEEHVMVRFVLEKINGLTITKRKFLFSKRKWACCVR